MLRIILFEISIIHRMLYGCVMCVHDAETLNARITPRAVEQITTFQYRVFEVIYASLRGFCESTFDVAEGKDGLHFSSIVWVEEWWKFTASRMVQLFHHSNCLSKLANFCRTRILFFTTNLERFPLEFMFYRPIKELEVFWHKLSNITLCVLCWAVLCCVAYPGPNWIVKMNNSLVGQKLKYIFIVRRIVHHPP